MENGLSMLREAFFIYNSRSRLAYDRISFKVNIFIVTTIVRMSRCRKCQTHNPAASVHDSGLRLGMKLVRTPDIVH